MKKAPILQNENVRLKALLDYRILDTVEELSYDDITLLASSICQTPIALVSLIDTNRQWFKSHHGLNATETPRDVSFCGHAIHGSEIFEIKDSLADPRFADNPLAVGAPHVRFYAGAPLLTPSGHAVGTLCVIDHKPRSLTIEQTKALCALARQVVHLLEMGKVNEELRISSQRVLDQQNKLIEAAKMSSLGIMADGIAHEINNPLTIIIAKSEQLCARYSSGELSPDRAAKDLAKISETSWRIQKIIKGLFAFSRTTHAVGTVEINIDSLLSDVLALFSEKAKSLGIELKIKNTVTASLFCCPGELCHVLLNLLNNSTDAISALATKWISLEVAQIDENIVFSITDSGDGIVPEVAVHLMEPFFTTKEVGKGTGLGLSVSRGLVEGYRGKIYYDEKSPKTRFVIELPLIVIGNRQKAA